MKRSNTCAVAALTRSVCAPQHEPAIDIRWLQELTEERTMIIELGKVSEETKSPKATPIIDLEGTPV